MVDGSLEGGFADPVMEAQTVFRAVLDALANPGTPQNLVTPHSIKTALSAQLASVVLTLTDTETPIWLSPSLAADTAVRAFIGFHTGAPIVAKPERSAFAFAAAGDAVPPFAAFNLGTQEYPDRSTTLVLELPALDGGVALTLRGPGIKDHRHVAPIGLPDDFGTQWSENRALFPRGVDLLLLSGGAAMGLPRTTRIEEGH